MPDIKINWAFTMTVDGVARPALSGPADFVVTAYDVVQVTVPPISGTTAGTKAAEIQPSTASDKVLAVVISADKYDPKLSYSVGTGTATTKIVVDGPQLFLGSGMIAALANPFPTSLTFSNETTTAIEVKIFVARKA